MRYSSKALPDCVLRKMPQEARAALGRAGLTQPECEVIQYDGEEKVLQKQICQLLDQRGVFYNRARMDKKTTTRKGMFDFTIYLPGNRFLAVEVKVKDGRLSADQKKVFTEFWERTGEVVHIVMSLKAVLDLLIKNGV